jgi:hypothetical protein
MRGEKEGGDSWEERESRGERVRGDSCGRVNSNSKGSELLRRNSREGRACLVSEVKNKQV